MTTMNNNSFSQNMGSENWRFLNQSSDQFNTSNNQSSTPAKQNQKKKRWRCYNVHYLLAVPVSFSLFKLYLGHRSILEQSIVAFDDRPSNNVAVSSSSGMSPKESLPSGNGRYLGWPKKQVQDTQKFNKMKMQGDDEEILFPELEDNEDPDNNIGEPIANENDDKGGAKGANHKTPNYLTPELSSFLRIQGPTSESEWWKPHVSQLARTWKWRGDHKWCEPEWISHSLTWEAYAETVPKNLHSSKGLIYIKSTNTHEVTLEGIALNIAYELGKRTYGNRWKKCVAHTMFEYALQNCHVEHEVGPQSLLWSFLRHPKSRDVSQLLEQDLDKEGIASENTRAILDHIEDKYKSVQTRLLIPERGSWRALEYAGKRPDRGDKFPRKALRRGVNEKLLSYLREKIFDNYEFLGITERMDESLAVMVILWELEPGDVIVLRREQQCPPPKTHAIVEKDIEPYLKAAHAHENVDYLVYAAANESLDRTIKEIGNEKVQYMVDKIQQLSQKATDFCPKLSCANKGDLLEDMEVGFAKNRDSECFYSDTIGCGHMCVAKALGKARDDAFVKIQFEKQFGKAPLYYQTLIHKLRNTTTKFYMYDDPAITQKYLIEKLRRHEEVSLQLDEAYLPTSFEAEARVWDFFQNHPLRTANPKEASVFLVPTPITELVAHGCVPSGCLWFHQAFQALANHPVFRSHAGHHHVILSLHRVAFNPKYSLPALEPFYELLRNVTVANNYDPFGVMKLAENHTGDTQEDDFSKLYPQEFPVTKAFAIGLGIGELVGADLGFLPLTSPSFQRFQDSEFFLFYKTSSREYDFGSTPFRSAAIDDEKVIQALPQSYIGYMNSNIDENKRESLQNIARSKFCLVVRGDSPQSYYLMYSVRAGCIPVVISDHYEDYASPFKSSLTMGDFVISIKESKFLADPAKALSALIDLKEEFIKEKLTNLTIAQVLVFPDHPQSLFAEALLKETIVTDEKRILPQKLPYLKGDTKNPAGLPKNQVSTESANDGNEEAIRRRFNRFLNLAPENRGLIEELRSLTTRFYVYDDPAISQSFLIDKLRHLGKKSLDNKFDHTATDTLAEIDSLSALLKHPLRTKDPDAASIFIVPTPIAEILSHGCRREDCPWYEEAFRALVDHPIFRKHEGKNHVIISYHWVAFNGRYGHDIPSLAKVYRLLENVTVAHHYDPFGCIKLSEKTKNEKGTGFNALFPQEFPVTNAFSVGLGIGNSFPTRSRFYRQFSKSKNFVFYHTRERGFDYGSTPYRRAILNKTTSSKLPPSSVGYDLEKEEWVANFLDSKFCLVVRGDTPHTHALLHSVRAGCIPVVVSDYYQEYAGSFKSSLNIEYFSIILDENKFLADPIGQLLPLNDIDKEPIASKLRNMTIAQAMIFPDHPESLFVEAFLKEAVASQDRVVPASLTRPPIEVREDKATISGKTINYRYSTLLSSPVGTSSDNDRLIVGVLSAALNPNARHMVRQTWAQYDPRNIFFLVAGEWAYIEEEFLLYGDLLWLDIPESYYEGLSYKSQLFLNAVEAHVEDYSYVLKTDDDSYVILDQLKEILEELRPEFWGLCVEEEKWRHPVRDPSHKHYVPESIFPGELFPVWAQGMGYVLSRKFNKCATRYMKDLKFMPMEDVSIGILAEKCKAKCVKEGYDQWDESPEGRVYRPVVTHGIKVSQHMSNLHWKNNFDRKYLGGRVTEIK